MGLNLEKILISNGITAHDLRRLVLEINGGPGSDNFGHAGRPGISGGSAKGSGGAGRTIESKERQRKAITDALKKSIQERLSSDKTRERSTKKYESYEQKYTRELREKFDKKGVDGMLKEVKRLEPEAKKEYDETTKKNVEWTYKMGKAFSDAVKTIKDASSMFDESRGVPVKGKQKKLDETIRGAFEKYSDVASKYADESSSWNKKSSEFLDATNVLARAIQDGKIKQGSDDWNRIYGYFKELRERRGGGGSSYLGGSKESSDSADKAMRRDYQDLADSVDGVGSRYQSYITRVGRYKR